MKRLGISATLIGLLVLAAQDSSAQTCDTSCPIRSRDAQGCCPGAAPSAPTTPATRPRSAPAPASRNNQCSAGQEASADTHGHCCWPGQAWSGSRCVGVPALCPDGYHVDATSQVCALETCASGRTRASDNVHCCFPGQAWSSRGECVGRPVCPSGSEPDGDTCVSLDMDGDGIPNRLDKCPDQAEDKDGFQDADGCPDPDNDNDGILDAQDKCPNEPEDKNGYKDEDGCPDEQERLAVVSAQGRADAAKSAKDAADREKAAAEAAQLEKANAVAFADQARASRKKAGIGLTISGVALAGVGGIFAALSSGTNSSIQSGGFATSQDIQDKNDAGKVFNVTAVVSVVIGGALVAIGVPLAVFNWSPAHESTPDGAGPTTARQTSPFRGLTFEF